MGEPTGGKALLRSLAGSPRLRKALVDGGYAGAPLRDLGEVIGVEVEVVGTPKKRGFTVVPRRWVVERTFAWLVKHRRLRIDYEAHARTSAAWIQAAMTRLMVRRIANA